MKKVKRMWKKAAKNKDIKKPLKKEKKKGTLKN